MILSLEIKPHLTSGKPSLGLLEHKKTPRNSYEKEKRRIFHEKNWKYWNAKRVAYALFAYAATENGVTESGPI